MVTFYMVYGKMRCTSCALYYCSDRHSHHSLYLCNLYHLHFCQEHVISYFFSIQSQEDLSEDIHLVVVDLHV